MIRGTKKNELRTDTLPASGRTLGWVEIGPKLIAANFSVRRRFDRNHPLRGDRFTVQPHGDTRLTDTLTCQLGQPSRKHVLTPDILDGFPKGWDRHGRDYNTAGVINVNTRCVIQPGQTSRMPKKADTSAFWLRLEQARTTCKPPKSMRQEDIKRDYGAAHQSTVTKWKTGKSLPKPEALAAMAEDCNVSVDWLWRGVGEMRPQRKLDPITEQIVGALEHLDDGEKLSFLKEIAAQPLMRRMQAAGGPKRARG